MKGKNDMFINTGFGHYAFVLRRWLWLIGLITSICTFLTYIINISTPPAYEASALIQVHDVSTNNNNVFTDQALAQSYALLINRPAVLHVAVQHIPKLTIHQLEAAISDSPLDNTQIIQVRGTAKDPTLAATITNTIVDVFIKIQIDTETTHLKDVATKLYTNLATAKQRFYADQAQLVALQDAHATQDRIAHQNDVLSSDQVGYDSLLTSYDQVQQQLLQVSSILTIAQAAVPPTVPSSPRTLLNTGATAALSSLTMIVFVLLLDWIDTSIKTDDDVEQLAHIKSLGSIPFCKVISQPSSSTQFPLINNTILEQPFIGISLNTITLGQNVHSILVTGLGRKSGISTVAANLAVTLARSGVRVLLIDANLHNASLNQIFKSSSTSSLTSILEKISMFQGEITTQVHSWLHQLNTHIPNLYFLPAGSTSTTSGTILLSHSMKQFLNYVLQPTEDITHTDYTNLVDIIILDSAALNDATDTLALAASVDSSILVINSGNEHAITLRKAYTTLDRFSCTPLGVIINRQKPEHKSYFYSNRYHQVALPVQNELAEKMISPATLQAVKNAQNLSSPTWSEASTLLTNRTDMRITTSGSTTTQNTSQISHIPLVEQQTNKYKE